MIFRGKRAKTLVEDVSREDLERRIEAIYEKWPVLREHEPTPGLDSCCQLDEVAEKYGWVVAWEWKEIQDWRWLMGDD